ncbi:MAG TPA: Crp/Fnr family transcriptional regulator [Puia sp.]|jgi:CRP/FNR family transcriptional regulator|nr:Crp/Fnr family transcriptional regulator [Puia sp.]
MDQLKEDLHPGCFLCRFAVAAWGPAIASNSRILHFKRGDHLFLEGEPVKGFYFVHSGKVKIHKRWGDAKELIIKFAGEMDILGHRGMAGAAAYPVSATAIEEGEACFISTEFFHTTLLVNHELAYQMVLFYADELQQAELGMRNMVHMDVRSRIADALLKLERIFGTDTEGFIRCQLTRQDVASYAGTTYETLFKTLQELTEEKVTCTSGKSIRINDRDRLQDLIRLPK